MQHGYGKSQFLKKSYLEDRRKALKDKTKYTEEELDKRHLDIGVGEGGGRTNPNTYEIWQYPGSMDASVRKKKKVDLRDSPIIG